MKRSRQGQVSKPQSAQHAVTCKSDSKRLEKEETGLDVGVADVIDRVEALELSAELDTAAEGDTSRPLDLLPTELVAAIFTEIVSSYVEPINRHKAPTRLLRISKRFHAIAIATPRLWKTIVVSGRFKARRLRSYLPRTKTIPLDVHVYGRFERELPSLNSQLEALSPRVEQLSSLDVRMSNHKMASALHSQLSSLQYFLDSLIIRSNRPASVPLFVNSGYLHTLVVRGVHLDWRNVRCDFLKHLDVSFRQLNDAVWDSFVQVLRSSARDLRLLSIRLDATVQGRPPNQPLKFGLLDTLRITDWSGGIALPFLASLEVPRLTALELSGNGIEWTSWNLEEELKSVEDLRLHDLLCGEDVLVSLVNQLPGLRTVSLRTEGVRAAQVQSLIARNNEKGIEWTVRLTAEDCSMDTEAPIADVRAAQEALEWISVHSDFSIKDFLHESDTRLPWTILSVPPWRLVDDIEWGKQVWLQPVDPGVTL